MVRVGSPARTPSPSKSSAAYQSSSTSGNGWPAEETKKSAEPSGAHAAARANSAPWKVIWESGPPRTEHA